MNPVAIFLPSRCTDVPNDLDNEGTGAREQVADWLAYELQEYGHEVHIFTQVKKSVHIAAEYSHGGTIPNIHYVDMDMAAPMLTSYDWEALISFDYPNVATIPGIKDHVKTVAVMQNYYSIPPNGECDPSYYENIDKWIYPSYWAASECPKISGAPTSATRVIPYTWDPRFFSSHSVKRQGNGNRFIYANQAESGLAQMLRMWPEIREEFPDSILTIATPAQEFVDQIQWSHHYQSQLALDVRDLMGQPGIRYIGRQGRATLAREMVEADCLLFPAEPLMPSEMGSLPLIQAAALGAVPVFTAVDALEGLYATVGHSEAPAYAGGDFVMAVREAAMKTPHIPDSLTPVKIFDAWRAVLGC